HRERTRERNGEAQRGIHGEIVVRLASRGDVPARPQVLDRRDAVADVTRLDLEGRRIAPRADLEEYVAERRPQDRLPGDGDAPIVLVRDGCACRGVPDD